MREPKKGFICGTKWNRGKNSEKGEKNEAGCLVIQLHFFYNVINSRLGNILFLKTVF